MTPFIRYTRDKRGYETTFVMHASRSAGGQGRTRVLYLFRSPAHVTVGRGALDEEAREALEHTHPDVRFDWQQIQRELSTPRLEPPPVRPWREAREARQAARPAAAQPAAPAVPIRVDDQSVLGRALGPAEAARLRARYNDLIQRITRRSRSPEERDQLLERAQRLNPDDWLDASAVRAGVSTVEAEWDTLGAALPQRRRGRRGGRRRENGGPATEPSGAAHIEEQGEVDEGPEGSEVARPDRDAGAPRDGDRLGPGPGPAGNDFPVDD